MKYLNAKLILTTTLTLALTLCFANAPHAEDKIAASYIVESIDTPKGLSVETGGIDFLPDGTLVAIFHRGEVYFYNPHHKHWHLYASGLHDPLGVIAINKNHIIVQQRPELTRLIDTDGDMLADDFQTLTDDYGISGNYHEFIFGPTRDPQGNMYIGLNTASSGAGRRYEVRGPYNPNGREGRMYACVPYRGWVMKITPDGKISPFASGFRSPNGLGFDHEGRLYAPDNQGDWIGTSPLYHIEKNKHYGHVASLAWDPTVKGEPLKLPLLELHKRRTWPAIQFPHGSMANSPTQPIAIPKNNKFGPFAGQMLIGEMNQARIIRLILEEVDGQMQGAAIPFIDKQNLRTGNNRLAFSPDGSLWVGQTDHGWAGSKGIQRITYNNVLPFEVHTMSLTDTGFKLTFTQPVDPNSVKKTDAYQFKRYYYNYHQSYGSPQFDLEPVQVTKVDVSDDAKNIHLTVKNLKAWRIYQLDLKQVLNKDHQPLANTFICYTLNHLRSNTPPAPLPNALLANPKSKSTSKSLDTKIARPATVKVLGTRLEAEDGKITGAHILRHVEGYTGKGFVDFNQSTGETATYKYTAKSAGPHQLMVRYALPNSQRPMKLTVNQKTAHKLQFKSSGKSWSNWTYETLTVNLNAGPNTITISSTGSSGPNVDHLQIIK